MKKPSFCPDGFDINKYDVCKYFSRSAWLEALLIRELDLPVIKNREKLALAIIGRQEEYQGLANFVGNDLSYPSVLPTSLYDFLFALSRYEPDGDEIKAVNFFIKKVRSPLYWDAAIDYVCDAYDFDVVYADISRESCSKLLTVNLQETDEIILGEFKKWLSEQRVERGDSIKRSSKQIDDKTLESWAEYKLLAYIDLLDWCDVTGNRFTHNQMGSLLYPDEYNVDVSERVRKTLPKMKEEALDRSAWWRLEKKGVERKN